MPSKNEIYNELMDHIKRQRIKDSCYDKVHDVYFYSEYEDDENLFNQDGCVIHVMDPREDVEDYVLMQREKNSDMSKEPDRYVFSDKDSKLLYFRNGEPETVKIDDMDKFKKALENIMETKKIKYECKYLNHDEIYHLITANGGHKPVIKQPISAPQQNPTQQLNKDETHCVSSTMSAIQPNKQSTCNEKLAAKIHRMFHHTSGEPKTNGQGKADKHRGCLIL